MSISRDRFGHPTTILPQRGLHCWEEREPVELMDTGTSTLVCGRLAALRDALELIMSSAAWSSYDFWRIFVQHTDDQMSRTQTRRLVRRLEAPVAGCDQATVHELANSLIVVCRIRHWRLIDLDAFSLYRQTIIAGQPRDDDGVPTSLLSVLARSEANLSCRVLGVVMGGLPTLALIRVLDMTTYAVGQFIGNRRSTVEFTDLARLRGAQEVDSPQAAVTIASPSAYR